MNGQEMQAQAITPQLFPAGHDEATGWPRWFMLPEKTVFITAPEEIVRKGIEAVTAKQPTAGIKEMAKKPVTATEDAQIHAGDRATHPEVEPPSEIQP